MNTGHALFQSPKAAAFLPVEVVYSCSHSKYFSALPLDCIDLSSRYWHGGSSQNDGSRRVTMDVLQLKHSWLRLAQSAIIVAADIGDRHLMRVEESITCSLFQFQHRINSIHRACKYNKAKNSYPYKLYRTDNILFHPFVCGAGFLKQLQSKAVYLEEEEADTSGLKPQVNNKQWPPLQNHVIVTAPKHLWLVVQILKAITWLEKWRVALQGLVQLSGYGELWQRASKRLNTTGQI